MGAALGTLCWQDLLLEQTYFQYSLAGSSWCRGRVVRRPPAQGGFQILGGRLAFLLPCSDKFQQFFEFVL